MPLWQWSVLFALSAGALVWAGTSLARSGDVIAERTRLGGLLVGMVLMAAATSLPEIATVMGAAAAQAPDLAVGSVFGSSMANMAILAILDLAHRRRRVWLKVELEQSRIAAIAILLTALAIAGASSPQVFKLGWIGFDTLLILLTYVAALAWIRRSPRSRFTPPAPESDAEDPPSGGVGLRKAVRQFAVASLVIFVAGPSAALAGDGIVQNSSLSETFVGVLFLAVATSLPELLASLGAVRIGAYDLAVGNLFGSNSFNMVVLLFADLAYLPGPILGAVDPSQVTVGIVAIGLMAIALAAIVHGEETRIRRLEPDATLLLVAYAAGLAVVIGAAQ